MNAKKISKTVEWIKDFEKVEKVEDTRSTKEMLQDLEGKFTELEKMQRYTLSEQEKLTIKTATIEELSRLLLDNQNEMRSNLDRLIRLVGGK